MHTRERSCFGNEGDSIIQVGFEKYTQSSTTLGFLKRSVTIVLVPGRLNVHYTAQSLPPGIVLAPF